MSNARLIFIPNCKQPLTALEIAELTNIPRHIISIRSWRSKSTKKYKGEVCKVLTEDDFKPPRKRGEWAAGKGYIVKLTDGEVEVIREMKGRTKAEREVLEKMKKTIYLKPSLKRWDDLVKKKNKKNG